MKIIISSILAVSFLWVSSLSEANPLLLKIRIFSRDTLKSVVVATTGSTLGLDGINGNRIKIEAAGNRLVIRKAQTENSYSSLEIPSSDHLISISPTASSRSRTYKGAVRITARNGYLQIINQVPLEDYVESVLVSEAPDLLQPEALKAMAIVSRSFAYAERNRHRKQGYDFCDSPHCQVYRNYASISPRLVEAVTATRALFLTHQNKVISAFYHACCGGRTETVSDAWKGVKFPYLTAVSDEDYENKAYCRKSLYYQWASKISLANLSRVAHTSNWIGSKENVRAVAVKKRNDSGRVSHLVVETERHKYVVHGNVFFRCVGRVLGWNRIRSLNFDVNPADRGSVRIYSFQGRGYGHGVGFCQSGADGMAAQKFNHQDILKHYYQNTQIEKLDL